MSRGSHDPWYNRHDNPGQFQIIDNKQWQVEDKGDFNRSQVFPIPEGMCEQRHYYNGIEQVWGFASDRQYNEDRPGDDIYHRQDIILGSEPGRGRPDEQVHPGQ